MTIEAIRYAIKAMETEEIKDNDMEIAKFIRKSFEKKYGRRWHCICHKNFACSVSFEENRYVLFQVENVGRFFTDSKVIALFKAGGRDESVDEITPEDFGCLTINETRDENPAKTLEEHPGGIVDKSPVVTSDEAPVGASDEHPVVTSKEAPVVTSKEAPVVTSSYTPFW